MLEIKNISAGYGKASVLESVSATINPGKLTSIVGINGSGKSTLINLVPRLYDATEGQVIVDGVNVKDYTVEILNSEKKELKKQQIVLLVLISIKKQKNAVE